MCKLCAIPRSFSREETIKILKHFEGNNTDGIGYSYVKNNQFN